jgi:hypothetical protein
MIDAGGRPARGIVLASRIWASPQAIRSSIVARPGIRAFIPAGRHSIDGGGLPGQIIAAARPSIADADAVAATVAGLVAVAAAVLTGMALPRRAARQPDAEAAPFAGHAPDPLRRTSRILES